MEERKTNEKLQMNMGKHPMAQMPEFGGRSKHRDCAPPHVQAAIERAKKNALDPTKVNEQQ